MSEPVHLSELVGRPVLHPDGSRAGRLVDVAVDVDGRRPRVSSLRLRARRHAVQSVPWSDVAALSSERVVLSAGDSTSNTPVEGGLLLARDVLDAQIVDLAGRRVIRVGDVLLAPEGNELEVVGVEVGVGPVLRRLGLGRLRRRADVDSIAWGDLHLVAKPGSRLQLAVPRERLHAMAPADLAGVLADLPPHEATDVLRAVDPDVAARAVGAGHPGAGAAMVRALPPTDAGSVLERMPPDDAVAALRHIGADARERVLGGVSTARADELRRLLTYPPTTAGGLMTVDHRTAAEGESAAAIRARLAARPPALDGLLTVFVVDGDERLVGTIPPRRLLADRADPLPLPVLAVDAPIGRVIDAFALHDVLALPVVDQERRVVGAVAVDDVLEELLLERLPGRRRLSLRAFRRRGRR
jgi:magnesium transporter